MEVYQSSKTAAEMEFALGAIPSIGANGNWFIGGVDTGVYAGGIKVEGAQVGQTIVVKAVDENGVPTEWEVADIPPEWEVIADVTTTEEVASIVISEDMNGNAFDLAEGRAILNLPQGSYLPNGTWYLYTSPGTEAYGAITTIGCSQIIHEYSKLWGTAKIIHDNNQTGEASINLRSVNVPMYNRFRFLNWSNMLIPVGARLTLVGRRANG